jgi:hypothetical protein
MTMPCHWGERWSLLTDLKFVSRKVEAWSLFVSLKTSLSIFDSLLRSTQATVDNLKASRGVEEEAENIKVLNFSIFDLRSDEMTR